MICRSECQHPGDGPPPLSAWIGSTKGKYLMLGDYVFLAHDVAREPGDPLTAKDARNCACAVAKLVETIRAYLPVEGRERQKSWRVQERAGCRPRFFCGSK